MFTVQNTANIYRLSVLSKEMHYHMLINETILFNDCFMSYFSIFFYYHIVFNPFLFGFSFSFGLGFGFGLPGSCDDLLFGSISVIFLGSKYSWSFSDQSGHDLSRIKSFMIFLGSYSSTHKPVGAVPGISSWQAIPHDNVSPNHISLSFYFIHGRIILINSNFYSVINMSYPYNHAINRWYICIDITYSCSKSHK